MVQNNDNLVEKIPKKRGRKPRGGKIVNITDNNTKYNAPQQNIILHLRCNTCELKQTYINSNFLDNNFFDNNIVDKQFQQLEKSSSNEINSLRDKLNNLAGKLHNDSICGKKSACFWCTCDFDNPPIFIPRFIINNKYSSYGCFCSPECAVAYLMKETTDTSTKFERYHLLNHLYCKIYDYKKNIKPAPDPFYTLSKFYGSLSIQEYRQLLQSERILLVVDKPLTRILPELYEDNDDFILNSSKSTPYSNGFRLRRNKEKVSKAHVLADTFNLK